MTYQSATERMCAAVTFRVEQGGEYTKGKCHGKRMKNRSSAVGQVASILYRDFLDTENIFIIPDKYLLPMLRL